MQEVCLAIFAPSRPGRLEPRIPASGGALHAVRRAHRTSCLPRRGGRRTVAVGVFRCGRRRDGARLRRASNPLRGGIPLGHVLLGRGARARTSRHRRRAGRLAVVLHRVGVARLRSVPALGRDGAFRAHPAHCPDRLTPRGVEPQLAVVASGAARRSRPPPEGRCGGGAGRARGARRGVHDDASDARRGGARGGTAPRDGLGSTRAGGWA